MTNDQEVSRITIYLSVSYLRLGCIERIALLLTSDMCNVKGKKQQSIRINFKLVKVLIYSYMKLQNNVVSFFKKLLKPIYNYICRDAGRGCYKFHK